MPLRSANVAIYPIDTRGPAPQSASGNGPIGGLLGGRGAGLPSASRGTTPPAGVSQEEYDRRVAYVQGKFGSTNNAMARTYLRYGAPDQVDSPNSQNSAQIWRYNYLEDFHGGAAFELSVNSPFGARVVYPPPTATYEGQSAVTRRSSRLYRKLWRSNRRLQARQRSQGRL